MGYSRAAHSLAQRPALANGDLVAVLNTECWGDVCGEVLVALLVTGVLGDEVEVLAADDQGTVHLGGHDGTSEDTATDGDESSEGALLVCAERCVSPNVVHANPPPTMLPRCIPRDVLQHLQTTSLAHLQYLSRASHTDVRALNGGLGRPEAQTDVLVPSPAALADLVLSGGLLVVGEDVRLLLVSALALDS